MLTAPYQVAKWALEALGMSLRCRPDCGVDRALLLRRSIATAARIFTSPPGRDSAANEIDGGCVRSILRGPGLSLGSQIVGLMQLLLLLWRAGANEATDAYFYLFSLGMLPIQVLIVGVMYPLLLNTERISRRSIRRVQWITPTLSVALMIGGAGFLYANGRLPLELLPLAAMSLINAFVQALLWFRSVTAEAGGNPRWNAAIALPANALALLTLLIPFDSPAVVVTTMVAALVTGNLVLLVFAIRGRIGADVIAAAPEMPAKGRGAHWFFAKATVGYVGLVILQSLAVLLPPSTVTILNVGAKIVGSIAATFVNAVMPVIIHHQTESIDPSKRFLRGLVGILAGFSVLAVVVVATFDGSLLIQAVCVGLWIVASTSAAIAQRMSFRFLPPSASRITIVTVPLVVLLALASSIAPGFQLVIVLCAYAALDGITATFLLFALRDRLMSWALAATCTILAAVWIATLFGTI
jgi:hypothetical protein